MKNNNEKPLKSFANESDSANSTLSELSLIRGGAGACLHPLRSRDHPANPELDKTFKLLYQLSGFTDDTLARSIDVERTTMNRYRRGVWIPSNNQKINICKILTEKIGKYVAVEMIWGDLPLEVVK